MYFLISRLFFETKIFEIDTETFFRDQIFLRPIPRLFLRPNIFATETRTFFRDQNFRDQDRYSQKIEKSLDTEKSRDEMSHSAPIRLFPFLTCSPRSEVEAGEIYQMCFQNKTKIFKAVLHPIPTPKRLKTACFWKIELVNGYPWL